MPGLLQFRARPDWQVLLYQQGLGVVAALKLLDSLDAGRWRQYAGEVYPWGRAAFLAGVDLSEPHYWALFSLQALLLTVYLFRLAPRAAACALAASFALDSAVGFENHRVLLSILFALVAISPVPRAARTEGYLTHRVYVGMELLGWQISLVYLCTAVHKVNSAFLSGDVLRNLFWWVRESGGRDYPGWLYGLLSDPTVCQALALTTIGVELAIAFGLHGRKTAGVCIPVAIAMHVAFALLMPWVAVFTALMVLAQVGFLPTRVAEGACSLVGTPPGFWRRTWQGTVALGAPERDGGGWELRRPDGEVLTGYDAWVELLSLSPWTFLAGETLRVGFVRALGKKLVG